MGAAARIAKVAAAALRMLSFDQRVAGCLFVLMALLPLVSTLVGSS